MKLLYIISLCLFFCCVGPTSIRAQPSSIPDSMLRSYRSLNSVYAKISQAPAAVIFLREHNEPQKARQLIMTLEQLALPVSQQNYRRGMLAFSKALLCGTDSADKCQLYASEAVTYLEGHPKERTDAHALVIFSYYLKGRFDSTIQAGQRLLPALRARGSLGSELDVMLYMARSYDRLGNRRKAIEMMFEAISLAKQHKEYHKLSELYISMSSIYKEQEIQLSKHYAMEALAIIKPMRNTRLRAFNTAYLALGNVYYYLHQPDSALYFYQLSKEASLKIGDWRTYLSVIGNMGSVFCESGNYSKALEYNKLTLSEYKKIGLSSEVAVAYGSLADIYKDMGSLKQAVLYYDSALTETKRVGSAEDYIYNYKGLSETYEKMGDYHQAFTYYKLYKQWNDSINNSQVSKKIAQLELEYKDKSEQKEKDLVQRNKDLMTQQMLSKQQYIIWVSVSGTLILLGFLTFTVRANIQRKKINARLQVVNEEVTRQKDIIEMNRNEIRDSIMYASRIQQGMIPDDTEMTNLFPNHFVFFRPRNIVSGDFYWASRTTQGKVLLAVADCTGHGVPGAFMSLVGNTLLNQTLNHPHISSPAQALDYINQQLPKTIKSKSATGTIKDGMEISMCEFDLAAMTLRFAGANSNIYLVRDGAIRIFRGDKQPIGDSIFGNIMSYTNHEIKLHKHDCIYLITDGFADQFGGPKAKKFKYKPLEDLFCEVAGENPDKQLQTISSVFNNWKSDHDQVDDVLVVGIEI